VQKERAFCGFYQTLRHSLTQNFNQIRGFSSNAYHGNLKTVPMALANGDKAAICSGIVAVGVVLGLIAYSPSLKDKVSIPLPANSAPGGNETSGEPQGGSAGEQSAEKLESTTTTPIAQMEPGTGTEKEKQKALNDNLTLGVVVDSIVTTPPPLPNSALSVEPATAAANDSLVIDCSVPASIPQNSQSGLSAILLDSHLKPVAGKTIVWHMSPGNYSFTSVTRSDGTAAPVLDLSGTAPRTYNVTATLDGDPKTACTGSSEIAKTDTTLIIHHGSGSDLPGPSGGDLTGPQLKITTPAARELINGSSFGVSVKVAGTAVDASGLASVEVRWTAKWGLTGYRMATPAGPSNWSTWSYDDIKFDTAGEKTILVKVTDGIGNKSWKAVTFNVSFTTDKISTSVSEGAVVTSPLHVTGTATDFGAGVQKVEVRTDLSGYGTVVQDAPGDWSAWSYDVTFTTRGPHQIIVRVTDNAGNTYWQTTNVTVQSGP
jgi:hypothetical protein